jgi:hypothetical protein
MDASQYKDYVLFMLFIKYITDKYGDSGDFAPPVTVPKGASFKDMIALKGKSDIGDKINTQIIQPLIDANARLARSDFPDFNDPNKLGEGQATSPDGRRTGREARRVPGPQAHHPQRAPQQRHGKAGTGDPRGAQVPASPGGALADRQVGAEAPGKHRRIFPATDENQVGKLQSRGAEQWME